MAYTGDDPFGPFEPGGVPYEGPGLDPSYYFAISPGGRFPGDTENAMEWQSAQARGTAGGNPNYDLPDFLTRLPGTLGAFFRAHEANARGGGEGQSPDFPAGYGYHFFSGPGADYGPQGGPLHGLVDMGRPEIWDTPEHRPPGDVAGPGRGAGRGGRGGRGGGGPINFGIDGGGGSNFRSSYVDWQPIQPGSPGPYEPTRLIMGPESAQRPASQHPRGGGRQGGQQPAGGGGGGRGGGGRGAGAGRGGGQGAAPTSNAIPPPGQGGMPTDPGDYFQAVVARLFSGEGGLGPHVGRQARAAVGGGVNVNNIDFMTPGWTRDRSAGTLNTSGFPDATLPGPNPGENIDQYRTRLHDLGYDQATIASVTGPSGFQQERGSYFLPGEMSWNWGTGPVVRDESGYHFANQGAPTTTGRQQAPSEGLEEFFTGAAPGSGAFYV